MIAIIITAMLCVTFLIFAQSVVALKQTEPDDDLRKDVEDLKTKVNALTIGNAFKR